MGSGMIDRRGIHMTGAVKGDSKWRLRRLNKIHVSGVPKDMVMGLYTSVAPLSDHNKIVVSQLERPKAQRVPSRF